MKINQIKSIGQILFVFGFCAMISEALFVFGSMYYIAAYATFMSIDWLQVPSLVQFALTYAQSLPLVGLYLGMIGVQLGEIGFVSAAFQLFQLFISITGIGFVVLAIVEIKNPS